MNSAGPGALTIITVPVTPFQQNCRILFDPQGQETVVVDPGGDVDKITEALQSVSRIPTHIFLTHAHLDHGGGVKNLLRTASTLWQVKPILIAHRLDARLRETLAQSAMMFGLPSSEFENVPEPDLFVEHGDSLNIGSWNGTVLFTPGHAPGHIALFLRPPQEAFPPIVIAGDTLFAGSIGRTDLPGGSHSVLLESITSHLMTLPDDTRVLPGHGPDTTIKQERQSNPFLR